MKRFLYILVLLFVFPSSLYAEKWDGEYTAKISIAGYSCPIVARSVDKGYRNVFSDLLSVRLTVTNNTLRANISSLECSFLEGSFYGKVNSNGKIRNSYSNRYQNYSGDQNMMKVSVRGKLDDIMTIEVLEPMRVHQTLSYSNHILDRTGSYFLFLNLSLSSLSLNLLRTE